MCVPPRVDDLLFHGSRDRGGNLSNLFSTLTYDYSSFSNFLSRFKVSGENKSSSLVGKGKTQHSSLKIIPKGASAAKGLEGIASLSQVPIILGIYSNVTYLRSRIDRYCKLELSRTQASAVQKHQARGITPELSSSHNPNFITACPHRKWFLRTALPHPPEQFSVS
jgi:hypothetical protein